MKNVTIRFFSPAEKLPVKSCEVLVIPKSSRYMTTVGYSERYNLFNCHDTTDGVSAREHGWTPNSVEYWAYTDPIREI